MSIPSSSFGSLIVGNTLVNEPTEIFLPPGIVLPYAGTSAPNGWILSYGQAIDRTTYSNLFLILGTTYGIGDGSTTFNLPDLRGNVVAGKDNMGGVVAGRLSTEISGVTLGATGGEESHILSNAEIPSHTHGYNQASLINAAEAATGSDVTWSPDIQQTETATQDPFGTSAPGGGGHNNIQPTFILNYIIKY